MKNGFLAGAIEVVKHSQFIGSAQFGTFGAKGGKVGSQIRTHTGKIGPGLLYILFCYRDRDIFFLQDTVAGRCFCKQHIVVFTAVSVQAVLPHRQ